MFIAKYRKIFYIVSTLVIVACIFIIFNKGLNLGIDFTGGALLEVEYSDDMPDIELLRKNVNEAGFNSARLQPTGEKGIVLRTTTLTEEEHQNLLATLKVSENYDFIEKRFDSIGPVIGGELKRKALVSISLVVLLIILFIAFAFRGVSRPVSSWGYGLVAIVALVHDVIIPIGIFSYIGAEVDVLFVTALLAILGYSVNDTIIIFDRIRENIKLKISNDFEETVGRSLSQTMARSINTSFTTLIVLGFLFFLGGSATKMFSLTLGVGVIAGTYSSIFLAGPLLVTIQKFHSRKK
ncbi:MAG: protein translocase subunit SecF [Parcubacteria group bacterium CG10_big_fil_rev_8_21_14_0_10_38_31]|nr:MAG: protein translocase subunit SecF [Parcubacteria group bacterium CG10_big_fil_rev_8_21_14_0_10_38_31]